MWGGVIVANAYKQRAVVSGDVIEFYLFNQPVYEGFEQNHKVGRRGVANEEDRSLNRERVLKRARRDLRRLINANIHKYHVASKFVTLTFKDNITDFETANYEFKKFRERLQYSLKCKLHYVVVPEFQKRGAIHFHVVMFNLPYITNSDLRKIWGNGFVKINSIDDVDNVGAYVCKYMTKSDDDRLRGKKSYFSSRGLKKPLEIKDEKKVGELLSSLPDEKLTYENIIFNEYTQFIYKQYNMNKKNK